MTILLTGNDQRVLRSLSALLCEKNKVIVSYKDAKQNVSDRRVIPFEMRPGDRMFGELFGSFEFQTVIYISSRHRRLNAENKGELDELRYVLELSAKERVQQMVLVSSTLIYWGLDDTDEENYPTPLSLTGVMLSNQEQLCRYFKERFGLNVVTLHVPFLYGDVGCDLLDADFMCGLKEGKSFSFPGTLSDGCDFLHESDLADLLQRLIDEPYAYQSGIINVASSSKFTFKELMLRLCNFFPQAKYDSLKQKYEYPVAVFVDTARRYYDWIPVKSFLDDFPALMDRYLHGLPAKQGLWMRFSSFFESRRRWLGMLELAFGFVLMEALNALTKTSAQFRFVDFRLLYIVAMGITHGIKMGIGAAVLAAISYCAAYIRTQADWEVLFYNIDNWLPLASYLVMGGITGNARDKSTDRELIQKDQQKSLEERYVFLYELYHQTVQNKNALKNQLIGYKDSFGRIYDAVSKLDSMESEEIFYNAIHVLEDVLESNSVAIYTVDNSLKYARLMASSDHLADQLSSSLKLTDYEEMRKVLLEGEIWCNKGLEAYAPAYCARVCQKGNMVAMITLWSAKYEQMTTAYLNLFKVLSQLVEASLARAIAFRASIDKSRYLPRTQIMVSDEFSKLLKLRKQMREKNIAKFKMVRVETRMEEPVWLSQVINSCIRSTDVVGQWSNGKYYILLSQTDEKNIGLIIRRLSERGILCTVEEI